MTTRRLPPPVRMVVDAALTVAVRRWPSEHRAELAAEWAAELHAIAHDPAVHPARRSWQCVSYSVSLAFARGIENDGATPMRRRWKPAAFLLGAPLLAVVVYGVSALVLLPLTIFATAALGVGSAVGGEISVESPAEALLVPIGFLLPLPVVALAGSWLGRHAATGLRSHPLGAPFTGGVVGAVTVAYLGVGLGGAGIGGFSEPGPAVAGAVVWTVTLTVVASVAAKLWARHQRRFGTLTAGIGGLLAVDLGVTVDLLLHESMSTAPLAYLPLWFPASLSFSVLPVDLGLAANGEAVAFRIWDDTELYPHLLLAVTAFVLGYLRPRARPATPSPEPTSPPAGSPVAGRP